MTTEQLQAQVDTLKVRVFDLSETIQGLSALRAQYEEVLQKLIAVSGVEISEDGVNIDSGNGQVTINGDFEALYNTIPGTPIANVSQIGVSKKVKIG